MSQSVFSVNYIDFNDKEMTKVYNTQQDAEEFMKDTPSWLECNFTPSWWPTEPNNLD